VKRSRLPVARLKVCPELTRNAVSGGNQHYETAMIEFQPLLRNTLMKRGSTKRQDLNLR
jgi:hypothetical protein